MSLIDLNKLIHPDAVARLRDAGLHKVAAAMLKQAGVTGVGEEITMQDVARVLGTRLREKNAQYSRIRDGLQSLRKSF